MGCLEYYGSMHKPNEAAPDMTKVRTPTMIELNRGANIRVMEKSKRCSYIK